VSVHTPSRSRKVLSPTVCRRASCVCATEGALGASRPPVDSGWIHTTAQVGITGKIVAPDVYFAVGLSGSSQHLTGMSDSRTVVAVNNDPGAYIFSVSDYGVVGDWRAVLPALRERLAELTREG